MKKVRFLPVLLLLSLVLPAQAQQFGNLGWYNFQGVPNYLDPVKETVNSELLQNIETVLPAGQNLQVKNPSLYNRNSINYITLEQTGDVFLSFISESADFKSSVGFFTFTGAIPASPSQISTLKVAFPNVSGTGSGGGLQRGHRVKLGNFSAGTKIGFFLIANGFRYGRVLATGNDVFYTEPKFNPEKSADNKKHTLLLYDKSSKRYVLLFEDFNREGGSDHDFNDAIFMISTGDGNVLSTEGIQEIAEEVNIVKGKAPAPERKITICHYPPGNKNNPQTITISESALESHEAHGDYPGACETTKDKNLPVDLTGKVISGKWAVSCTDFELEINAVNNGIMVRSSQIQNQFSYNYVKSGEFINANGNRYLFKSINEGVWISVEMGELQLKRIATSPEQTSESEQITICHKPPGNPQNTQTLTISADAWPAHQAHGDVLGACVETQEIGDVSGVWKLEGSNTLNNIRITPTGLEAKAVNSKKWFVYEKSDQNSFKDQVGNVYIFHSNSTGEWKNSKGNVVIKLTRVK